MLVEFGSASSEIRGRKKKKEKESVVKHKSANRYVVRPNKSIKSKKRDAMLLINLPGNSCGVAAR